MEKVDAPEVTGLTEEEKKAWNPFKKYLAPFIQEQLSFPPAVCPGIAQEIVNTITVKGIKADQVRFKTQLCPVQH